MRCSRCRAENRAEAHFCRECGAPLSAACPRCGSDVAAGSKFCDTCGAGLGVPPPSRFSSPAAYTPRYLAEKILTSRSAIEGERKQVTVLFVDLAGFTSLSERLDPEDVHGLITRAFELMLAEVHRYEGTVNQFLGDGIMALFGAPIAHEDHAARAVHAALGIRRALGQYEQDLRGRGIVFQVRQALNTGLVVVGGIGSDLRMDYTAVGNTTNVAARLQQVAAPGRVLLSDSTRRLVEGYFHLRALGPLPLKGKAEPVPAWDVISARSIRSRIEVQAERGLTPFVGRERELAQLITVFEKARAGHGQVVFLVGEAGMGKSRLLLEFRRRVADAATWLEGHALSFGQSIAFHPLIDLLKRQFRLEDGDSEETILAKIESSVVLLGNDLRPILPYLRALLSLDPGDAAVAAMDPRQRRAAVLDAVRRLLARAAAVQPQVIVYEDVQWMDRASEELLTATADMIPTSPILLVLTYRTGYVHALGEQTYHTRIALDALSAADTAAMAQALFDRERLSPALAAAVARKAEGNPFFLEELVRVLRDASGATRLDQLEIPNTVQDVIMARIDRLDEGPKRALQVASVIGRDFTSRLLDRLGGQIPVPVDEALAVLRTLEFVYKTSLLPEPAFTFRHGLTQEAAYGSLLITHRKELHRLIGRAIEELYGDRQAEHYEILAHHFLLGEDRPKALEYLVKAGDKAARAFANREAVGFYEQALALETGLAQRAELLRKLATQTQYLSEPDASLRHAEAALELFTRLGDKRGAVAMHLHIDVLYAWQWDGAREDWGLKHMEAAAALVEADPDSVEKGLVYQRTAHRYLHRSEPTTTLGWAQRAAEMFARLGVPIGTSRGTALTMTGRIEEGVLYSESFWEPVRKANVPVVMAVFGHELALSLALARDIPRARRWGEEVQGAVAKAGTVFDAMLKRPLTVIYTLAGDVDRARAACQAVETIEATTRLGCMYEDSCSVGFYHFRTGDWARARDDLERVLPLYRDRSNMPAVAACALVLGTVYLESGEHVRAAALLLEAAEIARRGGSVLLEIWTLAPLVDLGLATGDQAQAEAYVRRGFELLVPDRTWYGLSGLMHGARGRVRAAAMRCDEAVESLETAVAVNREHGLPWDAARAQRDLALVRWSRARGDDRHRARADLEEALSVFRQVGAQKEVERTLARKEAMLAGSP